MSQQIDKSLFEKLLEVVNTPEASVILKIAKKTFGDDINKFLDEKILIHSRNLKEVEVVDGDAPELADVHRRDGKNMYFSPADGWVAVKDEDVALYEINFDWLIRQVMNALDITDRVSPREILKSSIWALGEHRVDKQKIHLIVARNIRDIAVFDALVDYLNNCHKARNPALIISLDRNLPRHTMLPNQNELVKIDDAIKWDEDKFELNAALLSVKMGGTISKLGFSDGYRTLTSNGETYKFTPKQSEALEFMDGQAKPIHQTEILSHTSSQQGTKLRELFKGKGGKVHKAWKTIIKSDRKGNYWLDY